MATTELLSVAAENGKDRSLAPHLKTHRDVLLGGFFCGYYGAIFTTAATVDTAKYNRTLIKRMQRISTDFLNNHPQ